MSDTIPIHQVGPNCWDIIPRECGGARRAERRAARNNRIECPLNRNARRSRGGALTAMFTRARLYALPYPFSQASHASALLYTVITEFTIFSNPPQQAPAAAPSWARVKRPKKKKKNPSTNYMTQTSTAKIGVEKWNLLQYRKPGEHAKKVSEDAKHKGRYE